MTKQEITQVQEHLQNTQQNNEENEKQGKGDVVGKIFDTLYQKVTDDWVDLGLGTSSKGEDSSYFKVSYSFSIFLFLLLFSFPLFFSSSSPFPSSSPSIPFPSRSLLLHLLLFPLVLFLLPPLSSSSLYYVLHPSTFSHCFSTLTSLYFLFVARLSFAINILSLGEQQVLIFIITIRS
jgi:hypothetical protein